MVDQKKSSRFSLGLLIGSVVGAIAAFFFSPRSGKENREVVAKKVKELEKLLEEKEVDKKVKEIFGQVTKEAKELYFKAKKWLVEELVALSEAIEKIDEKKYIKTVEEVMVKMKREWKKESRQLERLKNHLLKEWKKLKH